MAVPGKERKKGRVLGLTSDLPPQPEQEEVYVAQPVIPIKPGPEPLATQPASADVVEELATAKAAVQHVEQAQAQSAVQSVEPPIAQQAVTELPVDHPLAQVIQAAQATGFDVTKLQEVVVKQEAEPPQVPIQPPSLVRWQGMILPEMAGWLKKVKADEYANRVSEAEILRHVWQWYMANGGPLSKGGR